MPSSIITHLRRSFLFGNLSEERLAQVSAATRKRSVFRGELVFQKGDRLTGLYLVATGRLKEACQSSDGNERIIEVILPHQTCGEAALMLDAPSPFDLSALVKSLILHIDRRAIQALIESELDFVARLIGMLSYRIHGVVNDIEACSLKNPVQRVAGYLIALCSQGVVPQESVMLPYAKSVIASRLGMTPEAFSRALRDLSDAGLIKVRGHRIVLADVDELKSIGL